MELKHFAAALLVGCNVSSAQETSAPWGGGSCALVVVETDYQSTNVAIVSPEGEPLSRSVVASKKTTSGALLSGDVVLPHDPQPGSEIVLIDRYPSGVLSWVETRTARVVRQLDVKTGFLSNPHDYLEVSPQKAYVTRYETNPTPGRAPFDRGGDLLIVDPSLPRITGAVDLHDEGDGVLPRPDQMTRVGDTVLVSLHRLDRDFRNAKEGRIVGIDPQSDRIRFRLDLPGFSNCGGFAKTGTELAIACSGTFESEAQLAESGVVVLDPAASPMAVSRVFRIAETLGGPIAPSLTYAEQHRVYGVRYGDPQTGRPDALFSLDTGTGDVRVEYVARSAFSLSDVTCACEGRCLAPDADEPGFLSWRPGSPPRFIPSESPFGLPPRGLRRLLP